MTKNKNYKKIKLQQRKQQYYKDKFSIRSIDDKIETIMELVTRY